MSYPGVDIDPQVEAAVAKAMAEVKEDAKFALTSWGKEAMNKEWDVKCPSGQWCRVRKVRFEDLVGLGIADNIDIFTSVLMAQTPETQATGGAEIQLLTAFSDPEKKARFIGSLNRVAHAGVVNPKVVLVDDGNLPEGTVFAGDIDFQDKMFLFGILFRGRMAELERFREEQESGVGDVAESTGIPEASE